MVPATQPYLSSRLVKSYLDYGHLRCETEDSLNCPSLASDMLDAMNQCNGNGNPNTSTGKCECNSGYYGADCLTTVTQLKDQDNHSKSADGARWYYFGVPEGESFDLSVSADLGVDVFVKLGTDTIPDNANFDAVVKN